MRGVHCSWVDMMAIREAMSCTERGDQKRLGRMRCVDKSTVSTWKAVIDFIEAVKGKVDLSKLSHFQPTHAREIARHYRKSSKPKDWTDETKDEMTSWADACEAEEWTVERLREELLRPDNLTSPAENGCEVDDLCEMASSGKKFGTIYADPPWSYSNQATRAAADNHYRTMSLDEIAALPVADLAADGCHLHLWTTNAFLFDCPRLFDAWGFAYQGVFVWCKDQIGIGNCWRVSHEFLLLAIRGEPRTFRDGAHNLRSWDCLPRGRHSSKPGKIRASIEKASPGPRLELFARVLSPGWTCWGNEIERDLFNQSAHSEVSVDD